MFTITITNYLGQFREVEPIVIPDDFLTELVNGSFDEIRFAIADHDPLTDFVTIKRTGRRRRVSEPPKPVTSVSDHGTAQFASAPPTVDHDGQGAHR